MAQDGGVVAPDVKHLEPLQVQVAVKGFDEHLPRGKESIEGPRLKVDQLMLEILVTIN